MFDDPVIDIALPPAPVLPAAADVVSACREIARGPLTAVVEACDRDGFYPREVLQQFGRAGALSAHLDLEAAR